VIIRLTRTVAFHDPRLKPQNGDRSDRWIWCSHSTSPKVGSGSRARIRREPCRLSGSTTKSIIRRVPCRQQTALFQSRPSTTALECAYDLSDRHCGTCARASVVSTRLLVAGEDTLTICLPPLYCASSSPLAARTIFFAFRSWSGMERCLRTSGSSLRPRTLTASSSVMLPVSRITVCLEVRRREARGVMLCDLS
jgi:hypothetical protein